MLQIGRFNVDGSEGVPNIQSHINIQKTDSRDVPGKIHLYKL